MVFSILKRKSNWKLYLAIGGVVILALSTLYTNFLARKLAAEEKRKVQLWHVAHDQLNKLPADPAVDSVCDLTLHLMTLRANPSIPTILVDQWDRIESANNFGPKKNDDKEFLARQLEKIKENGAAPIQIGTKRIYYKKSRILTFLSYFPLFQIFLIAAFMFIGYLGLNAARRAEQNKIWVGMAKETAHQLGTPISAILAWIEYLKSMHGKDEATGEIINELGKDVDRLSLIAERFSKIGSAPELEYINVYQELDKCRQYMERRSPRKVSFDFPEPSEGALSVQINPPLFDWVIENILRNALDAMGGEGQIDAEIYDDDHYAYIDITDSGKGIPHSKFKTVFQPGFTTKKRGWGLGLSLAKRIIETYHSGKIFVKDSGLGKGTTFTIMLPKHEDSREEMETQAEDEARYDGMAV